MSDAIYCYHLVSLCRVLLVFSVWLISISVNLMSQLCLIHFRMWLLLVATSLYGLVFYWHNESLKWTVLLQGSVFSRLAWLMTVLITHTVHCSASDLISTWPRISECQIEVRESHLAFQEMWYIFVLSVFMKQKHAQCFIIFHGTHVH